MLLKNKNIISKMKISNVTDYAALIEINNGQPISLMFVRFGILALEYIAKILTTGPRLTDMQNGAKALPK